MISVPSTGQYPVGHVHHFRLSVRILAGLVFFIIIAGSLEIGLRLWSLATDAKMVRFRDDIYDRQYSPAELRRSEQILPGQGGRCVRQQGQVMNWDPRFGLASKTLDMACAKELFKSARTKVVLLGGSTMGSAFAPNYLTTIENYAFGREEDFVSINLSESYARLSDMLARFIHEIIELRPNVAVFLVGFNEFHAMQYGGLPGDDFYWTAGVTRRVHHPMLFLLDKAIDSSELAQALLIKTGIYLSPRATRKIDLTLVDQEVDYYFRMQEYTSVLCRQYSIKCFFILQPTPLAQSNLNDRDRLLVQERLKNFPQSQEIMTRGYALLKRGRNGNRVLDASALFDGVEDAYFDVEHFTKVGNALLGKYIHDAIIQSEH
ncbi:MAG TPA: hypothetical protein VE970_20005 [Pseudolabrys sp.]|nr:hypothetical protein [Pseudolabrys sp.]